MRSLEKEKQQHRSDSEDDITTFKGFGKKPGEDGKEEDDEAMAQFYDYIEWTLAGHVE